MNDFLSGGTDKIGLVIRNYTRTADKGDKLLADSSINSLADNSIKRFADNSSTLLAEVSSNLLEDPSIGGLARDWPMTEAGFVDYDGIVEGNSTSTQTRNIAVH